VELAAALDTAKSGGLILAAVAHVFTIGYVANLLGEDEDWLHDLSTDMFPENGCFWVQDQRSLHRPTAGGDSNRAEGRANSGQATSSAKETVT